MTNKKKPGKKITTKWDRRRRSIEGKNRMVWVRYDPKLYPKIKKEQVRLRLSHID